MYRFCAKIAYYAERTYFPPVLFLPCCAAGFLTMAQWGHANGEVAMIALEIVVKLVLQALVLALACIPGLVWFVAYRAYDPRGFWEGFWFWGLTGWLLGTFQLGGFVLGLGSLFYMWAPKKRTAARETAGEVVGPGT